jgi:hypothetical protein
MTLAFLALTTDNDADRLYMQHHPLTEGPHNRVGLHK